MAPHSPQDPRGIHKAQMEPRVPPPTHPDPARDVQALLPCKLASGAEEALLAALRPATASIHWPRAGVGGAIAQYGPCVTSGEERLQLPPPTGLSPGGNTGHPAGADSWVGP